MSGSVSVRRALILLTLLAVLAVACAPDDAGTTSPGESQNRGPGEAAPVAGPSFEVPLPHRDLYDPVRAGETLPRGFRNSLDRDAIFPVYDPTFVSASDVDWRDEILVIGVDLEGEARAYPVGFLNRREIVIDNHRGIPTLVTW